MVKVKDRVLDEDGGWWDGKLYTMRMVVGTKRTGNTTMGAKKKSNNTTLDT